MIGLQQQILMQCNQLFCGCQYYLGDAASVQPKIYFSIAFMLVVLVLCVRIGSEWFIFKDYYPMKQKSPVLCIMMIVCIAMQLIIYPLAYTYNYFTRNWGDFKLIYRIIFCAFDGSLYTVYLMRSLRLCYAHEIDISRSKTKIFQFFKHEYFMASFLILVAAIKIVPIIMTSYLLPDENMFLTFIDINSYTYQSENRELAFGIKQIMHEFIWLCVMVYCLWLQTLVHEKYSMKNELLLVLSIGLLFNVISIGLYVSEIGYISIVNAICIKMPQYPILQLLRDLNIIAYFIISIVFPLCKKRVYHMLLPTGRHHDIVKTMRDFLMESEFIEIFETFLMHLDRQEDTTKYTDILEYWKQLMVIKFKATGKMVNTQYLRDCLFKIKELVSDIEEKKIKEIHQNLLNNLKHSILSYESFDQNQEMEDKYRFVDEISQKIEQLELIFLQKLDSIYKTEFRQTKSYYFLKMYLLRNKKININMISLGMAVMVESEEQL